MYKVGDIVAYKRAETLDLIHEGEIKSVCKMLDSSIKRYKNKIFYHVIYHEGCYPTILFEEDILLKIK